MENAVISFPLFGEGFSLNPASTFSLFGTSFRISWYGVIIAAGFLLAALYILRRSGEFGLTHDNIYDMMIFAVIFGILGARLYYVLFNWSVYFGPNRTDSILNTRGGGLAIYGGVIGGALAVFIYCKIKKRPWRAMFDLGGLALLIGQTAGRWGNFLNREAYGRETGVPWRMGLTTAAGTVYVHPTFLYESLWNAAGFLLLHFYSKRRRRYDGEIFLMYVAWYGLGRFFIEGLRTDSLIFWSGGLRVSQVLAGASFLAAAALLILLRRKYPNPLPAPELSETESININKEDES